MLANNLLGVHHLRFLPRPRRAPPRRRANKRILLHAHVRGGGDPETGDVGVPKRELQCAKLRTRAPLQHGVPRLSQRLILPPPGGRDGAPTDVDGRPLVRRGHRDRWGGPCHHAKDLLLQAARLRRRSWKAAASEAVPALHHKLLVLRPASYRVLARVHPLQNRVGLRARLALDLPLAHRLLLFVGGALVRAGGGLAAHRWVALEQQGFLEERHDRASRSSSTTK
mmetsp:Transcript_8704/g.26228  ORF Transcript_8704/g.26228 Transcript_8704/m.26228 type:complete len:225 (+) Transcript_8704:1527-2201(+)